jgi:hypothetical protein
VSGLQAAALGAYQRHRPETSALYEVVRDNLETLYGAIGDGALAVRIPKHARKELEAYLDCGLLCRGFARLNARTAGRGGWWRSVARAEASARRAPAGG